MNFINKTYIFIFTLCSILTISCATGSKLGRTPSNRENKNFLKIDPESDELFRVLLTSDNYVVSQMKYNGVITRSSDPGGDKYITNELKRFDKIDEVREGIVRIWLYPDSGNIMKIRPQLPTYLLEIDQIISADIQRWSFQFPKKLIEPTKFNVKYRVVLRKNQSDSDIIKEVREKMKESN
jgi:hypothetical protein